VVGPNHDRKAPPDLDFDADTGWNKIPDRAPDDRNITRTSLLATCT
jgi:hypothetical protein